MKLGNLHLELQQMFQEYKGLSLYQIQPQLYRF